VLSAHRVIVGVLQIVFAASWGVAFFGEVPDAWTVAGAALIVASTLAIARVRPRAPVAPVAEVKAEEV